MPKVAETYFIEETEEELRKLTRTEVTEDMNDKEIAFCEYYVKTFNLKNAAAKAGYDMKRSSLIGYKLRKKYLINRYIAWLKMRISHKCEITAEDIIEKYMRIAFADILDYVKIENNRLKLSNSEDVDGQIIKSVKQGRDGVTIELYDKLNALEKIEKFFDCVPKDWKRKIEERKLQLLEEKMALEREKSGLGEVIDSDDGFIEALKETAISVWGDNDG